MREIWLLRRRVANCAIHRNELDVELSLACDEIAPCLQISALTVEGTEKINRTCIVFHLYELVGLTGASDASQQLFRLLPIGCVPAQRVVDFFPRLKHRVVIVDGGFLLPKLAQMDDAGSRTCLSAHQPGHLRAKAREFGTLLFQIDVVERTGIDTDFNQVESLLHRRDVIAGQSKLTLRDTQLDTGASHIAGNT